VISLAGRRKEAAELLGAAEALYAEKGYSVGVARTHALLGGRAPLA
jgi:hypothetical protein